MIQEIVHDFFCRPILEYSGYNPLNTAVYAVILLVIAFGLVLPWLKRMKIPLNGRFLLALLPFIVLGSSFRIIEDLQLVPRSCDPFSPWFYTITPGIYLLIAVIAILILGISHRIGKEDHLKTLKIFSITGSLLALPILVFLFSQFVVWDGFFWVLVFTGVLTWVAWLITRAFPQTKTILKSRFNQLVFAGQMLDASATFTAIQFYSCGEQHVLSAGIINFFGPIGFVGAKFILMVLILYFADKEIENPALRNFIKIVIAIIGFAPGIRDALTLGVGTCL
ncbi:DUF63 family protein [Candidatus Micrarchaeota archaeon]|nr:DUF63 family protein [Candidatus Micrarchaeota archaeon]